MKTVTQTVKPRTGYFFKQFCILRFVSKEVIHRQLKKDFFSVKRQFLYGVFNKNLPKPPAAKLTTGNLPSLAVSLSKSTGT